MTPAAPETRRKGRAENFRPLRFEPARYVVGVSPGRLTGIAAVRCGKGPQIMSGTTMPADFLVEDWREWLPRSEEVASQLAAELAYWLDFYATTQVSIILEGMGPDLARPQVKAVVGLLIAHLSGTRLVCVSSEEALRVLCPDPRGGIAAATGRTYEFDGSDRIRKCSPASRPAMVRAVGAALAGYPKMPSPKVA